MDTREPSGDEIASQMQRILYEVKKIVVGQDHFLERVMVAILAQGHLLVEGVPGLAKTLTVNTLARTIRGTFKRIQFTPDLVPADLVGTRIYNQKSGEFATSLGPVFANLLLADEINRAPAKTQSALLEAMQERQVTVDGVTHSLSRPFITIATQNPLEQEGTYPLPEAQLDRFLFKLLVSYPSVKQEAEILGHYAAGRDPRQMEQFGLSPVVTSDQVVQIQQAVVQVIAEPSIINYITALVARTRTWPTIEVGASPRASVNLLLAGRALAACNGRNYIVPDDIKQLAPWVLRHRLRLKPDAEIEGVTAETVIQDIIEGVEAPKA